METIVSGPADKAQYVASSLADIAQFVEHLERNERTLAEHAETQRDKRLHEGCYQAYKHVADMLRRTDLRYTNLVRPKDVPASVAHDLEEYYRAHPKRFDYQLYDEARAWGLKDMLDAFLSWNGINGYTDRILAICKAAYKEDRS